MFYVIKKSLHFIIITVLVSSCAQYLSQEDIELQKYVTATFNRENKSTYVCDIPLFLNLNGDCGFIQVPVDYTYPDEDTYFVFWFFLPAENQTSTTKTIVPLQGGPGLAITRDLDAFIEHSNFTSLRKHNNILSFDYRGVGLSEPYDSRTFNNCDVWDMHGSYERKNEILQECQSILQKNNIQYSNITTANFIKDLDRILAYHNIDNAILYGISYGTRVALTAARDIPHRITGMVLDGVFPVEVNGFDQGLEAPLFNLKFLVQSFREHKNSLPENFGNIEQKIIQVASDGIQNDNQDTARRVLTTISKYAHDTYRFAIAHILLNLYEQKDKKALSDTLDTMQKRMMNDKPAYADIIDAKSQALFDYRPSGIYMALSIVVSEEYDAPFKSNLSEIKNLNAALFELFEEFQGGAPFSKEETGEIKNILQFTQADAVEFKAVTSDIPTLLFSGRRDMQTSPRWGDMVADNMSNSQHFIFSTEDHEVTFSNACSLTLFENFVKDPQSVKTLNNPCVEKDNAGSTIINNDVEELKRVLISPKN